MVTMKVHRCRRAQALSLVGNNMAISRFSRETPPFKQSDLTPATSTSVTGSKDEEVPNVDRFCHRNGADDRGGGPGGGEGGAAWSWGGGWLCRRRG